MVLDLERSEYLSVNATGSAIWELLADGATMGQLVDALTEVFSVDAEVAERDALEFIDMLRKHELITTSSPT
ncbi:MAG: PqqD family protein [Acidimicrobiia bacterium]